MITILRGSRAALDAEVARRAAQKGALALWPSRSARAWGGLRDLLAGLGERLGDGELAARLAPFGAALSLVNGVPPAELSPADLRRRDDFAARADSHLSHNLLVQRALFSELAALLAAACRGIPWAIAVPDLALLDRETLGALRIFYRRFPDTAPDLVAGFDPRRRTPAPDEDGLVWESDAEDVWRIAYGLLAVPGARAVDLEEMAEDSASTADAPPDPRSPGAPAAEETGALFARQRAAFEGYAFATALRLGLEIRARRPELSAAEAADLHGLTALSAHNRQFLTRGNQRLAAFLERHFRAAWEAETRPSVRSALAYRLAVTCGRRQARFAEAIEWADRAIAGAAHADLSPLQAAHLEGWGRNIRALALLRSGRPAEAAAECEAAFRRLDEALGGRVEEAAVAPEALLREAAFTHSLLADNLAAVYLREGGERFAHWKAQADRIAEPFPDLHRFEAITWIDLFRQSGDVAAALAKAQKGLAAARAEQDAVREHIYTVHLADLHDRRGEAQEAFAAFAAAEELRARLDRPHFLRSVAPQAAAAALRAGQEDEAERRYGELLAADPPLDTRAQLLAAWGEAAAHRADSDTAEARLNEAISAAVESGERDTLLAVAVAAGRAAERLGHREDAREAYERALEIATGGKPGDPPPPPALELAARVGLCEIAGATPEALAAALQLLPAALDDASAWWELDRLATLLERAGRPELATSELERALAERRPSPTS